MKKHKWLIPFLWFSVPTLLLGGIQLGLAVAPLFAANLTSTFIGGMQYLGMLISDPAFGRFLVNTVLISSATPLLFSLVGGILWLILRKGSLSTPVRYAIVYAGTTLLAAVTCYFVAIPDLPEHLQLMGNAAWGFLLPSLLRYGLICLQCGVFACLFHFVCAAIARRKAKKSAFTVAE